MIGMDRETGMPLSGLDHLRQSIGDILTTSEGSRRERPEYGSRLARFVDLPVTAGWLSAVQAEASRTLGRWEPRIKLESVRAIAVLDGQITFALKGEYLGDSFTLEVTA
ncbi:GPW/gp25 family protein [Pseudomonas viridiflava]|uniref:GPW/gp25 family protein n=1 Tax=Pseudomonas viridiflava TaxID=33069 RepID=UPI000F0312D2|nr:GPW/gp25 family protein [Pseudomonas viridiflava]